MNKHDYEYQEALIKENEELREENNELKKQSLHLLIEGGGQEVTDYKDAIKEWHKIYEDN